MEENIEIKIIDSYLNLSEDYWTELGQFYSSILKCSTYEAIQSIKLFSFEKEFAVKWYELLAYSQEKVVGFMRVLRNPDRVTEWYTGDVHVLVGYKKQGIATKMYSKAIDIILEYEAAERIITSISCRNVPSIALHEKLGFHNTKMKSVFANFLFDEDDTLHERWLMNKYPVKDMEIHHKILLPMWIEYMFEIGEGGSESELMIELQKRINISIKNDYIYFDIIFSGNNAIGFIFYSIDGGIKDLIPPGYGYIMEIYIQPSWRKRYIAHQLALDICKFYKENGCEKVYLTPHEQSTEFWSKQGFTNSGLKDPDNNMCIYIKDL
jgi:ribosomal protein S18 acetylase RimI-like enzyme